MASTEQRLALAEQQVDEQVAQAKARGRSKYEKFKQSMERLLAIDKQIEGSNDTLEALMSEKEKIEAECEMVRQELETDITALKGMNGASINETSSVETQDSLAASKKPVGAMNQPNIFNTKAPTSAVQAPAKPNVALPSRPSFAAKHPSVASGSSTTPVCSSEHATPVSQNHIQPRTSHKPTAAPSTRPAPEVQQSTTPTNSSTSQANAQKINAPLANSSTDPYTPAQQNSDTPNHQPSADSAGDKFNATPRSEVDSIQYNLQTGPGQLAPMVFSKAKGLKGFEVVLLMDGEWTEVKCCVCGRNATKEGDGERYIGGIHGLYTHAKTHVEDKDKGNAEKVFEHIERRMVSDEDVALMRAGMEPKVEIPMNLGNSSAGNPKHSIAGKRKMESPWSASSSKKMKTAGNGTAKGDDKQLSAVKAQSTTKQPLQLIKLKKSNAEGLSERGGLPGSNL